MSELFLRKSEMIRRQESRDQIVIQRLSGFQNKSSKKQYCLFELR